MCQALTGNESGPCPWGAHSLEKGKLNKQITVIQCGTCYKKYKYNAVRT